MDEFLEVINKNKKLDKDLHRLLLYDQLFDIYPAKALVTKIIYMPNGRSGGSVGSLREDLIDKESHRESKMDYIYQEINHLSMIAKDWLVQNGHLMIKNLLVTYFDTSFDEYLIQNQLFLLRKSIGYVLNNKYTDIIPEQLFGLDFKVNKIDNRTSQNVIVMSLLSAETTEKSFEGIIEYILHIITENVEIMGNLLIYFNFAPWMGEYKKFLDLLTSNFMSVEIVYPLNYLPISNKCYFVCHKKLEKPIQTLYDMTNLNKFARKMTYYLIHNTRLLFFMLNKKINQEDLFYVILTKLASHFESMPFQK